MTTGRSYGLSIRFRGGHPVVVGKRELLLPIGGFASGRGRFGGERFDNAELER